jgi:hypothetical protein
MGSDGGLITLMIRKSHPMGESIQEMASRYAYHEAFDYFNERLFDGTLPPCSIWLSKKTSFGAFFPFGGESRRPSGEGGDRLHLIQINPAILTRPTILVMSVLVHEQCHLWQWVHGAPARGTCHDRQWSAKLESIGLMPSRTGRPGGKPTGHRLSHYVIEGGPFEKAFSSMPETYLLPWRPQRVSGSRRSVIP